jgi:hypothetical protein
LREGIAVRVQVAIPVIIHDARQRILRGFVEFCAIPHHLNYGAVGGDLVVLKAERLRRGGVEEGSVDLNKLEPIGGRACAPVCAVNILPENGASGYGRVAASVGKVVGVARQDVLVSTRAQGNAFNVLQVAIPRVEGRVDG